MDSYFFEAILACIPGHVYWKGLDGAYLGCNDVMAQAAGVSKGDELIGKSDYDVLSKEEADQIRKNEQLVISTQKAHYFEETVHLPTGKAITTLSYKAPLRDKQGNIVGITGISIDITDHDNPIYSLMNEKTQLKGTVERQEIFCAEVLKKMTGIDHISSKSTEQYVHEMTGFLKDIIAAMPGLVCWRNTKGEYLGCNDNVADFFGVASRLDVIGRTAADFIDKKLAHDRAKQDEMVMKVGHLMSWKETLFHKKQGERCYLTKKVPLRDRSHQMIGILGVSIDITEEERAKIALEQANVKLQAANQAKKEFLANISHEIRTPLTGILGQAEHLDRLEQDPDKKAIIDDITTEASKLLDLFNTILEFLDLEKCQYPVMVERFDIKALLANLLTLLQMQVANRPIQCELNYLSDCSSDIESDKGRVEKILVCLLSNAVKFTQKGKIILSCELMETQSKRLLKLVVEDTGVGIAKDRLSTIFDEFTRLSPAYEGRYQGVGLGLSTVKTIAQELGGEISIESTLGKGSKFTCLLPVKLFADPKPIKEISENVPEDTFGPGHKLLVLVVEDDRLCQMMTQSLLENELECQTVLAGNLQQAKTLLVTQKYDMILMDIGLPDGDGISFTKEIRRTQGINQHTPIIATTAHTWDKSQYFEVGMNDCMIKPLNKAGLQRALKRYVIK